MLKVIFDVVEDLVSPLKVNIQSLPVGKPCWVKVTVYIFAGALLPFV